MRFSGQVVAFGAMLLVGGAFLPTTQAHAFGQQWRPTAAHAPAQAAHFRRVANMPSFRPRVSAASPRYRSSATTSTRPVMQPMVAMRPMAPPAYPPAYQRPAYAAPGMWSAMPAWSNPFTQMAQAWQYPMPVYPRQFAWQRAEQPWITQRAWPQQRERYSAPTPPAGYRAHNSLSAVHGMGRAPAWRQPRPSATHARYAAAQPAPVAYRPVAARFAQPEPLRGSGFAAAGMQPGHWRPHRAATPAQLAHTANFRPAGYGRSTPAERQPMEQRVAARQLPGWVTTYQDSGDLLTCGWCSGS